MTLEFASVLAYLLMGGAAVGLVVTESILPIGVVSATIQAFALGVMVWARITFGSRSFHVAANPTKGGLATTGPYKYVRHPIYASALLFIWAAVFCHFSPLSVCLGVSAVLGASIRIGIEERLVTAQYPEYAAYADRTKRLIPFVI